LDGCFTLAGASFLYGAEPLNDSVVFVPAAVEALFFSGRSASSLAVRCLQRERNETSARFDLFATDGNGEPVLQIIGLTLRRVRKEQLVQSGETSLAGLRYGVEWRERALSSPLTPLSGRLAVLTDCSPLSEAVCSALKGAGVRVLEVSATGSGAARAGAMQVDPLSLADMERFAISLRDSDEPITGILSLWGNSLTGNLNLVQGLMAAHIFPQLCLLTSGVHDPAGTEREVTPAGAALWGFGASVAVEVPGFSCRLLDLSPWPGNDELALLIHELASSDGEDRVALRGGRRFVPRLVRTGLPERHDGLVLPEEDGFYLDVEERGSLEGICVRTAGRRPPESGELAVQVRAVGLNFRDVLNVLGRYPGDPGIPGFECSGRVVAVGSGIEGVAVGDRVFVFNVDGCIADYLTISSAHVVRIPDNWCFEEAAAVPVAFLTAWHGLHNLAAITKGDRVLIHAAAGGVGLAAVQLCRAAGATVFATAGSPEKRELLQGMGVEHVMDSRSLAFAEQIAAITEGQGVDIVLNSLAGEFINRSLELLSPGGRFIEIGKADTLSSREIETLFPQITYRRFDLADITEHEPALVVSMFGCLFSLFDQGILQPLPMTVFPVQRAKEAFRFMAQARHIGKVIISLADRLRERRMVDKGIVDPEASYLITGGLGALGLAVAGWLAEEGCRHLVLVGRKGPSAEADATVEKLRMAGLQVAVMTGDVAEAADVSRIMTGLRAAMPPLKGIFHAAGLLDDSMLVDLDAERLERVLRPKIDGAWNLHRATEKDDLELFVLFSSLTAVTGSPGQANYAAANAALDGFARWRRSRGLAAVSINWGPWGEAGMAAQEGREERLLARGIRSISIDAGLQALATVLRANPVEQCVVDLDLQRLSSFIPSTGTGLYSGLLSRRGEQPGDTAVATTGPDVIRGAPPAERPALMLLLVRELAAKVMGLSDPGRIESDRPLQEQGFDSLMSVDLRNMIARTFSVELPVSLLFDYPTPEKISAFLLEDVLRWQEADNTTAIEAVVAAEDHKSADELVDEIEQLLGA
jgi:NADPH:quinone reductase-like Zn-dependent oxidoreductase/acyl carrier protein